MKSMKSDKKFTFAIHLNWVIKFSLEIPDWYLDFIKFAKVGQHTQLFPNIIKLSYNWIEALFSNLNLGKLKLNKIKSQVPQWH